MKKLSLLIESCSSCPYLRRISMFGFLCLKTEKDIKDFKTIDKDCPLDDLKVVDAEFNKVEIDK